MGEREEELRRGGEVAGGGEGAMEEGGGESPPLNGVVGEAKGSRGGRGSARGVPIRPNSGEARGVASSGERLW